MKLHFRFFIFLATLLSGSVASAQKQPATCLNADISSQADVLKNSLTKRSYLVYQEAMLKMHSMEPLPIVVQLTENVPYEFIFIGSEIASKLSLEIFDGQDKKIDQKTIRGTNELIYTFTPEKTDAYLLTLMQKKGTQELCSYFGILVKKEHILQTISREPRHTDPVRRADPTTNEVPLFQPTDNPQNTAENNREAYPELPANQQPNPNRTRATRSYQQQQTK